MLVCCIQSINLLSIPSMSLSSPSPPSPPLGSRISLFLRPPSKPKQHHGNPNADTFSQYSTYWLPNLSTSTCSSASMATNVTNTGMAQSVMTQFSVASSVPMFAHRKHEYIGWRHQLYTPPVTSLPVRHACPAGVQFSPSEECTTRNTTMQVRRMVKPMA